MKTCALLSLNDLLGMAITQMLSRETDLDLVPVPVAALSGTTAQAFVGIEPSVVILCIHQMEESAECIQLLRMTLSAPVVVIHAEDDEVFVYYKERVHLNQIGDLAALIRRL